MVGTVRSLALGAISPSLWLGPGDRSTGRIKSRASTWRIWPPPEVDAPQTRTQRPRGLRVRRCLHTGRRSARRRIVSRQGDRCLAALVLQPAHDPCTRPSFLQALDSRGTEPGRAQELAEGSTSPARPLVDRDQAVTLCPRRRGAAPPVALQVMNDRGPAAAELPWDRVGASRASRSRQLAAPMRRPVRKGPVQICFAPMKEHAHRQRRVQPFGLGCGEPRLPLDGTLWVTARRAGSLVPMRRTGRRIVPEARRPGTAPQS